MKKTFYGKETKRICLIKSLSFLECQSNLESPKNALNNKVSAWYEAEKAIENGNRAMKGH
jgi:hypothetical protein